MQRVLFLGRTAGRLLTLKYLHDVYQNKQCVTLNSPYLSFYYYYYDFVVTVFAFFVVLFLIMVGPAYLYCHSHPELFHTSPLDGSKSCRTPWGVTFSEKSQSKKSQSKKSQSIKSQSKKSQSKKSQSKKSQKGGGKIIFGDGLKINGRTIIPGFVFELISIVLSAFFLKLLHDIGKEETCKDIDPTLREVLFWYNVIEIFFSSVGFFGFDAIDLFFFL